VRPRCGALRELQHAGRTEPGALHPDDPVHGSRVLAPNAKDTASITTPATGHLEVTVDWLLASDFVSVALAQAPCSVDQLSNSACDVLFSQFSPPKPLANSTSLLRAGTYTLIVANLNPIPESVSTQVVLTSAGCAGS